MKFDPWITPLTEINLKWIENVRPETIKLLEKKVGKRSLTLIFKTILRIWHQKHKQEEQNQEVELIKLKSFFRAKEASKNGPKN